MKTLTLILFFIFTVSAYSFDINNLNNMFKSLDDTEPKLDEENEHCCDPKAKELEQINQCAIDLCGKSGTVDSIHISNDDYEDFYKDSKTFNDYEEFKPKLKKYLDIVRANTKIEMEGIKSMLTSGKPEYLKLDSYSDEQISSLINEELIFNIGIFVIKDKNGKKKIHINSMPFDVEIDEEIKKKFIKYTINQIETMFPMSIYEDYLELEEGINFIKKAVDKHILEIEKRILSTPKGNTAFIEEQKQYRIEYEEIKNKIENTKKLTKMNVVDLFESVQNVDFELTKDLDLKYYNVPYESFECGDLKCREYLSKKIALLMTEENLNEIIAQTQNKKRDNELIDDCEFFWHQDHFKKAKPGKKKEFIDAIPEILNEVENNFSSKFSKKSSDSIGDYLKSLKYAVADDEIPGGDNFDMLESTKYEVMKIVEPDKNDDGYDDYFKGVLGDYKKIKKHIIMGDVMFRHMLNSCNEANVNISDHFYPSEYSPDTYVHVSSFSCNHYTTGKQVFAHELGHAISGHFLFNKTSQSSSKKYKDHRNCISGTYKGSESINLPLDKLYSFDGDTKYTEEDMADFVASLVHDSPSESLLSCALIAKDKNNEDYDKKQLSVLNPHTFDTHSSPFLRTLKEAIHKNKVITPSCRKIIDKYSDRINFNKCEF